MAGLLDMFGTAGQETLGLLGGDIARARDDAQAQALYALAGSLLSGGPTGLSIVRGLQQGQQAYRSAMRGALDEQLQGVQVADLLRKRKLEEEALKRQQMIDRAVAGAYVPGQAAVTPETPVMDIYGQEQMGPNVPQAAVAPRLDIQSIAPALLATREGRTTLADLMKAQEAMQPKLQTIGEGQQLGYVQDGKFVPLASAPKPQRLTGEESNIALRLFGTNDPAELTKIPGASQQIENAVIALKRAGATTLNLPSGEERKAAVLANRMNFSVGQMNEAIGKEPTAAMPKTLAEAVRFFTGSEFLANKLTPEQRQVVESAQLDVLDAALTLGTGAAYTREQLEGYRKSYFPQLGDSDKAIQSKQKRLENLLQSAQVAAGRAAPTIPTRMPSAFEMPSQAVEIPSGVTVRKRQ